MIYPSGAKFLIPLRAKLFALLSHLIYLGAYFPIREGWFTSKPTGHSSLQGQASLDNLYHKLSQYKLSN
jgi:hypothetical protein